MELAPFIRRYRGEIVDEWLGRMKQSPLEPQLSPPLLIDELPDVLANLADTIDEQSVENSKAATRLASHHAIQRLGHGFELHQLMAEYALLRTTILDMAERAGPPGTYSTVRFNQALDRVVADSVDTYAAEFERARERFVDILGHDLRNPLSVIGMGAQLLATGAAVAPVAKRIERNVRRMEAMVADLLDFARGRQGHTMPITVADTDMGEICRSVADEVAFAYPQRAIRIDVGGNLRGRWDADRVTQALTNLVSNSIAHGTDPIVVSAADAGDEVVVSVANAGEPIDPAALPRIFEPYQLGPITTPGRTRTDVGLGLGLFIVREVVHAHGGKIAVKSDPNVTEFVVRLPRLPPS
jgi:signal transduction histidine kinase